MNYEKTLIAADGMIQVLRPFFIRDDPEIGEGLQIAGSLRRGSKKEFDEIDLIGIPDLSPPPRPRAEFGKPIPKVYETKLDQAIDKLAESGHILITQNGPRAKKFFSCLLGIKVDLTIVRPPATWGVLFAIRTGPEDFSHWIVTRQRFGGALPDGYRVQYGAVYEGEGKTRSVEGLVPIGFDTEESFLDWLGLGWIEPGDRLARWGRGHPPRGRE